MDGEKVVLSREEYEEALAYTALHQQALAKLLGETLAFIRNHTDPTQPDPTPARTHTTSPLLTPPRHLNSACH